MAQLQQIQFAETIRAMKRAMKRRADDADSDSYISAHTNRGHKLERDAKRVQQDRLGDAVNTPYRRKIEHAGYSRMIISTNPPYVDDDGDLYSNASSDRDDLEPLEDNPFGDIRLETLLRPLTSASELPHHPTLSLPYRSPALTNMTSEAEEMLRRERANLWKAKRMLQRLRGDADWVPCGVFDSENGDALLNGDAAATDDESSAIQSVANGLNGMDPDRDAPATTQAAHETITNGAEGEEMALDKADREEGAANAQVEEVQQTTENAANGVASADHATNGVSEHMNGDPTSVSEDAGPGFKDGDGVESDAGSASNGANMHAMTTRARARSPTAGGDAGDEAASPSPSDSASLPAIHPWFLAPAGCFPDRDLALPPMEAEEARRLLLLYVQKQEQIVRSLESLYFGLQKADRLRRFVLRACKAEAHVVPDGKGNLVTEMSDGEDWFDIEDWGLTPRDLKGGTLEKGKDEVEDLEEEGRKVRGRRRVNRM